MATISIFVNQAFTIAKEGEIKHLNDLPRTAENIWLQLKIKYRFTRMELFTAKRIILDASKEGWIRPDYNCSVLDYKKNPINENRKR